MIAPVGLSVALCVCAWPALAQTTFVPKRVTVPRIEGKVRIDGKLDDAAWSQAVVIRDVVQYNPGDGDPPSEPTEFLLMSDAENLYIGARFGDSDPAAIKRSQMVQGQGVTNDDYLQVVLDTYNNRRTGYLFYVNPNGVQRDGLLLGGTTFNMDWDGIWEGDAAVDQHGWTAEVALPFKTLAFDPRADVWGINLIRSIRRKREDLAWSQRDRRITLDLDGEIAGMAGRDQGTGLDVVPSMNITQRSDFAGDRRRLVSSPSLDAFYRITPSLAAALTVNTDFSATDVDDRQVNLTRFSLFFPEKRDFFLEDTEVFEFGGLTQNGRPFFSRTIGLSAQGQPIDLDVGTRISGKIGRYTVGALAVRQGDTPGLAAQDLFVGRAYASFGEQSTIGVIATSGDPAFGKRNSVLGADLLLRTQTLDADALLPRGVLEARAWMQQSSGAGSVGEDGARGVSLAYPNDRIDALLGYTEIDRNFKPALGFVNRTDIAESFARTKFRHRFERGSRLRSWLYGFDLRQVEDRAGRLQSRQMTVTPFSLEDQPGDTIAVDLARYSEVLAKPFVLPGSLSVPLGRYDYDRVRLYGASAGFRSVAMTWDLEGGDFYDGRRRDAKLGLTWKPQSRLLLGAAVQNSQIELPRSRFTARVYTVNANYSFGVRWAWLNIAQYDNVSRRLGLNSRLRWWPTMGQMAYLVVNYDWREDVAGNFRPFLAETTVKFNYTFRY